MLKRKSPARAAATKKSKNSTAAIVKELPSVRRKTIALSDEALESAVARELCEREHLTFTRYFFKARHQIRFIVNWHHVLIADIVDQIIQGRLQNVIINVPPGGTKTELVVINLIARGLALTNGRARFLHLTGASSLASQNSSAAKDLVQSDEFQNFWPMRIADDASAKARWNVEINGVKAGGVYATAIGGQVTGFRAGHMAEGFQGAIIIDDPVKPEDAFSKTKTDAANRKLITTVKSRRANPKTPIILIMQRTGPNDPTQYLINNTPEMNWKVVRIPAILDAKYIRELEPKYRSMVLQALQKQKETPGEYDAGRFSYWPYKEPLPQLLEMEKGGGTDAQGNRVSRFVFASQYDQRPKVIGGNIIKSKDFVRYRDGVLPAIQYRKIYSDTAQKEKEHNDFSVFVEVAKLKDGRIAVLDLLRGKWEGPELKRRAVAFWAKAKPRDVDKWGRLREMKVEDKSSGTDLIQTLKLPPYNIPIKPIERDRDRFMRVTDALPYIEAGQVLVPEDAPWTNDLLTELEGFTADDTHENDDQVDPVVDAVEDMLQTSMIGTWIAAGKR